MVPVLVIIVFFSLSASLSAQTAEVLLIQTQDFIRDTKSLFRYNAYNIVDDNPASVY